MPIIGGPRATLPRGYPATPPLVVPVDGARLSTAAREGSGPLPANRALVVHAEAAHRRLSAMDAETAVIWGSAQNDGSDESARSLRQRANAAYVRMRDSHIQLLPDFERLDITV